MATEAPAFGVITDEGIARLRRRIGVEKVPKRDRWPHNTEVTVDAVRHFAFGYGDDNPLFVDPDYAATTRWDRLIAPPTFIWSMGEAEGPASHTPEEAALMKGDPLRGVGALQAQFEYEFYSPLTLGDRLYMRQTLVGVIEKESSFSGRGVHTFVGKVGRTQDGRIPFYQRGMWIRNERKEHGKVAKEHLAPEPYTDDELAAIDEACLQQSRRGAEPRTWESVAVGEELTPKVKGPLRMTDILIWHIGFGMNFTPAYNFELSHAHRRRKPGMYTPDPLNIPDTVQRMHWEEEWAKAIGMPARYDYGAMRETFLAHLLTDWMGDDGWLWKLSVQHRHPNFLGDTTWVRGKVTGKEIVAGHPAVILDVWCENQRGQMTSTGSATVLLPSGLNGPVVLPDPPGTDPQGILRWDIDRLAATDGGQ